MFPQQNAVPGPRRVARSTRFGGLERRCSSGAGRSIKELKYRDSDSVSSQQVEESDRYRLRIGFDQGSWWPRNSCRSIETH